MNQRREPSTFIVITPTMRVLIENIIEDLLLLLDEIDGDADMEAEPDQEDEIDANSEEFGIEMALPRVPRALLALAALGAFGAHHRLTGSPAGRAHGGQNLWGRGRAEALLIKGTTPHSIGSPKEGARKAL
jgi:hypothetical protein